MFPAGGHCHQLSSRLEYMARESSSFNKITVEFIGPDTLGNHDAQPGGDRTTSGHPELALSWGSPVDPVNFGLLQDVTDDNDNSSPAFPLQLDIDPSVEASIRQLVGCDTTEEGRDVPPAGVMFGCSGDTVYLTMLSIACELLGMQATRHVRMF